MPRFRGMRHTIVAATIGTLVVAAGLLLTGCNPALSTIAEEQVPAPVAEGSYTLLWGPEIKPQALTMIEESTGYCHLTMYELSDGDILRALAQAEQRGVDVEVVLDASEPHSQSVGYPYLKAHHVKVRLLSIPGGISHIKSLVVQTPQGLQALIGGMNFGSYSWENHDASIFVHHADAGFEGLFEQDYARAGGDPHSPIAFAQPLLYDTQIEPAMLQAIGEARQSIDMEAFAFTSRTLVDALAAAVSRGVKVAVVLDHKEPYNRRTAERLIAAGAEVRYYAPYQGEYLHAKILSVDAGRMLFVGSANFSYHGFAVNHEGDLELEQVPQLAASVDNDVQQQLDRGEDPGSAGYGSYGGYGAAGG